MRFFHDRPSIAFAGSVVNRETPPRAQVKVEMMGSELSNLLTWFDKLCFPIPDNPKLVQVGSAPPSFPSPTTDDDSFEYHESKHGI